MFRLRCFLSVAAKDGGGVFVRVLDIPEEPVVGLRVRLSDSEVRKVRRTAPSSDEGEVNCDVGLVTYEGSRWERIKARYESRGWSLLEEVRGTVDWTE